MSNVTSVIDYRIAGDDQFFFDANIWILLFCPIANSRIRKQRAYGNFLEYVVSRQRPIHLNALVVSEFINAWLRMSYKVWASTAPANEIDYKRDYVGSGHYKETVSAIQATMFTISALTTKNNDDFNAVNLPGVLTYLTVRDFNDNYYLELASRKKLHIVSDDSDMFDNNSVNVKILTDR